MYKGAQQSTFLAHCMFIDVAKVKLSQGSRERSIHVQKLCALEIGANVIHFLFNVCTLFSV